MPSDKIIDAEYTDVTGTEGETSSPTSPLLLPPPRPRKRTERIVPTDEEKAIYLEILERSGSTVSARAALGWGKDADKGVRSRDPEFQDLCDDALARFRAKIEGEVYRRAVIGWEEPVVGKEKVIAQVTKYSDRLLELLVKRHSPEFRDKHTVTTEVTHNHELSISLTKNLENATPRQRQAMRELLAANAEAAALRPSQEIEEDPSQERDPTRERSQSVALSRAKEESRKRGFAVTPREETKTEKMRREIQERRDKEGK